MRSSLFSLPDVAGLEPAEAARLLAAAGFRVFPCRERAEGSWSAKTPRVGSWPSVATCAPEAVDRLWASALASAIGLPTGGGHDGLGGNELVVIDVDVHRGDGFASFESAQQKIGALPHTLTVATPSGGQHFYFLAPAGTDIRNSASQIGAQVDVRGCGGYVIAPGSRIEGVGSYVVTERAPIAPLPERWIAALKNCGRREKDRTPQPRGTRAGLDNTFAVAELARQALTVARARVGERNHTLNKASYALGKQVRDGALEPQQVAIALAEACTQNGLIQDDGVGAFERTLRSGFRAGVSRPPDLLTENAYATAFAEAACKEFRYDHTRRRWHRWSGSHWKVDEKDESFLAVRRFLRSHSKRERDNRIATARAVLAAAACEPACAISANDWNIDPYLLGTPDGVVDLRSGILSPADPSLLINAITSVSPAAPGTPAPLWEKFLGEATAGDKELQDYLQRVAGYCCTGDTSLERFFFLHGPGGNGKGVAIGAIAAVLGDYARAANASVSMESRSERHLTELARLHGARLVTSSETEAGRSLAVARVKELTGNERPVTANFMRQDHFEYRPTFKIVIVGNERPRIPNVDAAIQRRLDFVPFTHQPAQPDPTLKDRLKSEYPAILRWMIDGAVKMLASGLPRPAIVRLATGEYLEEEDLRALWFAESVERVADGFEASAALFKHWSDYARAHGADAGSSPDFGRWLSRKGLQPDKVGNRRGFKCVRLVGGSQPGRGSDPFSF